MKISAFKEALQQAPHPSTSFHLAGRRYHPRPRPTSRKSAVSSKTFIDCGGTVRKASTCLLQAWVADDTEHRLEPGTLASILERAAPILDSQDLDMEIEYEDCQISQFPVEMVATMENELQVQLGSKHTDCLAKDVCLPDGAGKCGC